MASLEKTYYFPPTWDVLPDGPLVLGTVLSSTKLPLPPLLISPVTSNSGPTASSIAGAIPEQPQIYNSTKYNLSYTTSSLYSASVSISASLAASVLGIGPDAHAKFSREHELTLRFARVDTQEWYPSTAELQARVGHPTVSRFLGRLRAWTPKSIFVVTGVKVGYGARAESGTARAREAELEVAVDPSLATGVPDVVEFGLGAGLRLRRSEQVGWESSADGIEDPGFVFAYKLQQVNVKIREGKVVDVTGKAYTKGALYEEVSTVADRLRGYEIDTSSTRHDTKCEGVLMEAEDKNEIFWLVPVQV